MHALSGQAAGVWRDSPTPSQPILFVGKVGLGHDRVVPPAAHVQGGGIRVSAASGAAVVVGQLLKNVYGCKVIRLSRQ